MGVSQSSVLWVLPKTAKRLWRFFYFGGDELVEINTPNGVVQILYQMTLGEVAIVAAVSLLILLILLKWLLDLIWFGGRR
jgi:hypothetical protein